MSLPTFALFESVNFSRQRVPSDDPKQNSRDMHLWVVSGTKKVMIDLRRVISAEEFKPSEGFSENIDITNVTIKDEGLEPYILALKINITDFYKLACHGIGIINLTPQF